ncbi:MAG: SMC-Scp complex subunit ScpB, partial [Euryarchaeota archaeon]|nr:SMC-Scp complex subunit ScpB [Euryarchaeota archaeon]
MNNRDLLEAALFVAGRPLTLIELESIVSIDADVEGIVASLVKEYREGGALEIVQTDEDVVMQV